MTPEAQSGQGTLIAIAMSVSASVSAIKSAILGAVSRRRHEYSPIPAPATQGQGQHAEPSSSSSHRGRGGARLVKMSIGGMVLLAFLFIMASFSRFKQVPGCELTGNCLDDTSRIWGQYSPWFPAPSEIDASVPEGCQVTFAQVLSRHGARWPTTKKSDQYRSTINRIQSAVARYGVGYGFVEHFKYNLGANDLTDLGKQQMAESGAAFYRRYEKLAEDSIPFIRASGSDRVIASAKNFVRGFYDLRGDRPSDALKEIIVIPETLEFNNTLGHATCPAFEDGPASELRNEKQSAWLAMWAPPITQRLNENLPGANLTLTETLHVMDLCPFITVATPNATVSDFCRLFSHQEWAAFDYYQSLDKWYGFGQGNPLGPSQGVGFGNELIARLTGQPVDDHTTTNTTLDSSTKTFPLDRKLYADFSHDNVMSSIFAALGFFNATGPLPVQHMLPPRQTRGFSAAWTVPFSGRMYVEKMQCGSKGQDKDKELVRVLVNGRVVPLQGCRADDLGRCELSAFVESLSFVRAGGSWNECFFRQGRLGFLTRW